MKKYNEISEKEKDIENKIIHFENENNLKREKKEDNSRNEINNNNIKNPVFNEHIDHIINIKRIDSNLNPLKDLNKEKNKINEKDEFLLKYKQPTLIGLDEIKNGSYMNAFLQCLSQTYNLTRYFLKNQDSFEHNKNNMGLSEAYFELIKKLWEINGPKSFSPINFKNALEKINPIFKNKEFEYHENHLFAIIEQLHKEQRIKINCNFLRNNNLINEPLNQYDKQNTFSHFINKFKEECSIISDIFIGILETNNVCLKCKDLYSARKLAHPIIYDYDKFNYIEFQIEEVRYKKIANPYLSNNQIIENSTISLYDCFNHYQKTTIFEANKNNICNMCKQSSVHEFTKKIYSCPNHLILVITKNEKNDIKLVINEIIDITEFIIQKEKDLPKITYSLYGLISRIKKENSNPYYISSCKSPIDLKWYRYNNDEVTPINNIQKEVICYGKPCILFYKKNGP